MIEAVGKEQADMALKFVFYRANVYTTLMYVNIYPNTFIS